MPFGRRIIRRNRQEREESMLVSSAMTKDTSIGTIRNSPKLGCKLISKVKVMY